MASPFMIGIIPIYESCWKADTEWASKLPIQCSFFYEVRLILTKNNICIWIKTRMAFQLVVSSDGAVLAAHVAYVMRVISVAPRLY